MNRNILSGGRVNKIFKSGEYVIRPADSWTDSIHDFLKWMKQEGADFVPFPVENMGDGKEVLTYMPGEVYNEPLPNFFMTDEMLISASQLLKKFHTYSERYIKYLTGCENWMLPKVEPMQVLCHGDFAPYNVTIIKNRAANMIDFDTLHPGPKMWDIVYAIYRWVPFTSDSTEDVDRLTMQITRTKLFLDTYGINQVDRRQFVSMLQKRLEALTDFMKSEAASGNKDFQKNIDDGHLNVYFRDIEYIGNHEKQILQGIL